MRILKIALQNINSLQSEQPIAIDFASESFEEIGVFAITGPTGAGKSSILDAIMIALYHQVPRLGNGGERELEKCISYGSTESHVTIDFEVKNIVYQAYWGVSTVTKTGKAKKPEHKFRVGKWSENGELEVLADRTKTEVEKVLRDILPLDANQFMKSVLLAQGQFDNLLKANNSDRAKLLQQITGEDIYERISEEVQKRKSEEIHKEELLRNSISNKYLLAEEEVTSLKNDIQEQLKLREEVQVELSSISKSNEYFQLEDRVIELKEQLQTEHVSLSDFETENAVDFNRLGVSDKLEPYRTKVTQYYDSKSKLIELSDSIKNTEDSLSDVQRQLSTKKSSVESTEKLKEKAIDEDKKWRPVLEEIQILEQQIKRAEELKGEWLKEQSNFASDIEKLLEEQAKQTGEKDSLEKEYEASKNYLDQYSNFAQLDNSLLVKWSSVVENIRHLNNQYKSCDSNVKVKLGELEEINSEATLINEKSNKIKVKLESVFGRVETLKSNSEGKGIDEAISRLDECQSRLDTSKELYQNAIEFETLISEKSKLEDQIGEVSNLLEASRENLVRKTEKFQDKNAIYEKNLLIIQKEQKIHKYEAERIHLIDGEECPVCGSLEHPFSNLNESYDDTLEKENNELKTVIEALKIDINQLEIDLRLHENNKDTLRSNLKLVLETLGSKTINQSSEELKRKITALETELASLRQEQTDALESAKVLSELENEVVHLQKELSEIDLKLNTFKVKKDEIESLIKENRTKMTELMSEMKSTSELAKKEIQALQLLQLDEGNLSQWLAQVESIFIEYQNKQKQAEELKHRIEQITQSQQHTSEKVDSIKTSINEIEKKLRTNKEEYEVLTNNRSELLPSNVSVTEKKREIEEFLLSSNKEYQKEFDRLNELKSNLKGIEASLVELTKSKQNLDSTQSEIEKELQHGVDLNKLGSIEQIKECLLSLEEKAGISEKSTELVQKKQSLTTKSQLLENELNKISELRKPKLNRSEVENRFNDLKKKNDSTVALESELRGRLSLHDDAIKENAEVESKLKVQQQVVSDWTRLYMILGNSKTAYNIYVQRITLSFLLESANHHLKSLNPRYSLTLKEEFNDKTALSFDLVDHYHLDAVRPVETASGGEKFLISLGLALALADMSSQNLNIDTLFIDEGFGSLDPDSVELALNTLETLHTRGKTVGIISHVELIKERISTQVNVIKQANGFSRVEIVS